MFKKTKIKQIISLIHLNSSNSFIANALDVSRNSVIKIRSKIDELNLSKEDLEGKEDDELYEIFFPTKFKRKSSLTPVDYNYVHDELKKVGVTLKLLWEEYVDDCKKEGTKACSYPTFVINYEHYTSNKKYTSHIDHRPGEDIEVDWSGPTMHFIDVDSGSKVTAYLFVATLPYSQKIFVEATTSMDQDAWMNCNVDMLNYFEGSPLRIICDNCKTAVISHPRRGEIELNEEYLAFGEYYGIMIKAANVRKPKEKPSVEGSVGKIATKIIAKLRNESFYSLEGLNKGILKALDDFNNAPFQKRDGSRNTVFEIEEKPYLRKLPLIPYEVSSWTYGIKVMFNTHICYKGNFYSVPFNYINKLVDVKANKTDMLVYYNKQLLTQHKLFSSLVKNKYRTKDEHLDKKKEFNPYTYESVIEDAKGIGLSTLEVVNRLFSEPKVKEQAFNAVLTVLSISKAYSKEILEDACKRALDTYSIPHYKQILEMIKMKNNEPKQKPTKDNESLNVRGSDYYK